MRLRVALRTGLRMQLGILVSLFIEDGPDCVDFRQISHTWAMGNAPIDRKTRLSLVVCLLFIRCFVSSRHDYQSDKRGRVRLHPSSSEAVLFLNKLVFTAEAHLFPLHKH